MSGIRERVHAAKHSQGTGTKSHPALFYSHFIGKGSSIPSRKICAPKKDPPCDGYFGCHGDGSMRGKAKGETMFLLGLVTYVNQLILYRGREAFVIVI